MKPYKVVSSCLALILGVLLVTGCDSDDAILRVPVDIEEPQITISSPDSGSSVSGAIDVIVYATDNDYVSRVAFEVYSENQFVEIGEDQTPDSSEFSVLWNTLAFTNGDHDVRVTAYDQAGNYAQATINVIVENEGWEPADPPVNPAPGDVWIAYLGDDQVPLEMIFIKEGEFAMGCQVEEQDSNADEIPRHRVTFLAGFWIGRYEVTQAQWVAVMDYNPALHPGLNHPVEQVSWEAIQEFETELGNVFRLPSESEWEYACRAGTSTRFYWGDDGRYEEIDEYGVYGGNNPNGTAEVGTKRPNNWGLFDMSGNVWEWCEDWYHEDYIDAPDNGNAWLEPDHTRRVRRGGGWYYDAGICRSANRDQYVPSHRDNGMGFRVVMSLN